GGLTRCPRSPKPSYLCHQRQAVLSSLPQDTPHNGNHCGISVTIFRNFFRSPFVILVEQVDGAAMRRLRIEKWDGCHTGRPSEEKLRDRMRSRHILMLVATLVLIAALAAGLNQTLRRGASGEPVAVLENIRDY